MQARLHEGMLTFAAVPAEARKAVFLEVSIEPLLWAHNGIASERKCNIPGTRPRLRDRLTGKEVRL